MTQSDYLSRREKCRERAHRFYREANDLIDRRLFFSTRGLESSHPRMVGLQNQIARLQARAGAMERQASRLYDLAYPPRDWNAKTFIQNDAGLLDELANNEDAGDAIRERRAGMQL